MTDRAFETETKQKNRYTNAIVGFFITLGMCLLSVLSMANNRVHTERLVIEQLITEQGTRINERISHLMFTITALETHVRLYHGEIGDEHFQRVAQMLVDDPAVRNITLAPGNVITNVFPFEGNEALIGRPVLLEAPPYDGALSEFDRLSIEAKEIRAIAIGGPHLYGDAGYILIGRSAVFIEDERGNEEFWGIIGITLNLERTLKDVGLESLCALGYKYTLWWINPDTGLPTDIRCCESLDYADLPYVESAIGIVSTHWYLRVYTPWAWHSFIEVRVGIAFSFFISLLVALLLYSNANLKKMKDELEKASNTDALTGVSNRRFFEAALPAHFARIIRQDTQSFIFMLDIDKFKEVNDVYGHPVGDAVLKEVAARITSSVRGYDLVARYGGEEFIVFASEIDRQSATRLAQRMKNNIAQTPIQVGEIQITITASIGVAQAAPANTLEQSISFADRALYKAKNSGRNSIRFCRQCAAKGSACPEEGPCENEREAT